MTLTIPRESIEQIHLPIHVDTDPTGLSVGFAFTTTGRPATFTPGSWTGAYVNGKATAKTPTIGATGAAVVLTAGVWHVWVRITSNPETPVLAAGTITIT